MIGFDNQNPKYLIKTDEKRLQQIVLNLYSNAIKFTDRNGFILILIEKITSPDLSEKDKLIVSVTDLGLGIEEVNQDKLFKLFGSIKDEEKKINTQGIGLGLVISKLIV